MNDKEKEFVKNVNIDKAKNKTMACIGLTIISLFSYVVPLIFGDFDFGMIFEIFTLIFILMARHYMSIYDEDRSKRFTIFAMIPIGWLLIYDLITILSYVSNVLDLTFFGFDFVLQEVFTILDLSILFAINKDLRKADNPEKYKESTDWFYERLDEKEDYFIK
ncbi:MAG: hypothetical protein J5507_07090 [Clostridia bacterium]|nr:hypothetical protein [Clostridia bacterium]